MSKIIWVGPFPPRALSSIGDQSQTLAVQKWFKDYFPNWEIVRFYRKSPPPEGIAEWGKLLKTVKNGDLIFIHSSGDWGTLFFWTGMTGGRSWHDFRRKLISTFPNNNIIQLPVSVFYEESERGRKVLEVDKKFYKGRENVLLMGRDLKSYEILAQNLACKNMFVPDFAFDLKPTLPAKERRGALIMLRNDHETRFDVNHKIEIIESIKKFTQNVVVKDIQMRSGPTTDDNRANIINDCLSYYRNFKVTITDRFHGMIFSVITKTPCVAIDDKIPHKCSGYKNLLFRSVKFVNTINEIPNAMEAILSEPYQATDLSPHFKSIKRKIFDMLGMGG